MVRTARPYGEAGSGGRAFRLARARGTADRPVPYRAAVPVVIEVVPMSQSPPAEPVIRIARRRAKPGCVPAYEALVGGMLRDVQGMPGFIGGELIPPTVPGGEHQTIMRFEHQGALDAWDASPERRAWHERIATVADGPINYQELTGLEAWFARPEVAGAAPPQRWKMAIITWLGIWPTVMVLQLFLTPQIRPLPFVVEVGVFTLFVVAIVTYLVMPRLVPLFRPWLARR